MFKKFFSKKKDDNFSIPDFGISEAQRIAVIRKALSEQQINPKEYSFTDAEIRKSVKAFDKAFREVADVF